MWHKDWRKQVWENLPGEFDVIIIGGGITGAGILREASRAGLRVLLVEGKDFAYGTSSRSGKLVHGGLRYLRSGQIKLTLESVRERDRLLKEGEGLIAPLGFLFASFAADRTPGWVFGAGLAIYNILGRRWALRHYPAADLRRRYPMLSHQDLAGGYHYLDAQTDDARLILRLIAEAVQDGGRALNYAEVESLLFNAQGQVRGVAIRDTAPGGHLSKELHAPVVINATGVWADELRQKLGARRRLRRLRGSHLLFPWQKLPLPEAISFLHPVDQRPLYVFPWEGVTILGTTDVDHHENLEQEPRISLDETEYLMQAAQFAFPDTPLSLADVRATFAGIRAVVDSGKADPSKESREFVLWEEQGLLTVAGGKLTTFRLIAHDALRAVRKRLPGSPRFAPGDRVLNELPETDSADRNIDPATLDRLFGRYGAAAPEIIALAGPEELVRIQDTPTVWAELRWAARNESVVHLDDLLLRRVRLGLLAEQGAIPLLNHIRSIVQPELGWDDQRWAEEVVAYSNLWCNCYSLPMSDGPVRCGREQPIAGICGSDR